MEWLEGRRLRAWELSQAGWRQKDIVAALGVSKGAVSQWLRRGREQGPAALRRRKARGPRPRLTDEQRALLPLLLARDPAAYGFRGALWTEGRVAEVIRQEFGVRYHPAHVGRILKACGWSPQKPLRRAAQRDEEAIQRWKEERWPALQKRRRRKGAPSSL